MHSNRYSVVAYDTNRSWQRTQVAVGYMKPKSTPSQVVTKLTHFPTNFEVADKFPRSLRGAKRLTMPCQPEYGREIGNETQRPPVATSVTCFLSLTNTYMTGAVRRGEHSCHVFPSLSTETPHTKQQIPYYVVTRSTSV